MRLVTILTVLALLLGCGKQTVQEEAPQIEQPSDYLALGDQYFAGGDFENAFRAYGVIYYEFPTSREYIDAAIGLSRCYSELENFEKGFDILYTLLRENLIPSKVPTVYNEIARFYEKSAGISEQLTGAGEGDYLTAISYYQKAIDYPGADSVDAKGFAQYKIGVLHERLDDVQKAVAAYQNTINGHGQTPWAARAEEQMAALRSREQLRDEYRRDGLLPTDPGEAADLPPAPALTPVPAPPDTGAAPPDSLPQGGN